MVDTREVYVEHAVRNLLRTSRTAHGRLDASASKGKRRQLAQGLTPLDVGSLATGNYRSTIIDLYDRRNLPISCATELRDFVESIVLSVNRGLVREGALYREDDSSSLPYTRADTLLSEVVGPLFEEFHQRLTRSLSDPVETAGWVEYRMDLTDHLWADGCGRSTKAVAAWVLMRAGHSLPVYPADRRSQFAAAPCTARTASRDREQEQYEKWLRYYRSLFETWPGNAAPAGDSGRIGT
ncbi:hypothetical protein [Streptomyces sediminimaris]|uniref:hypothetical protein n=1 Tax=Streptomyces sediminimaris TaxID=3383721 RepID=UPI00399AA032